MAISGTSWSNLTKHLPQLVSKVVAKGTVFARMTGMQKQQLVEELKNLGYSVGKKNSEIECVVYFNLTIVILYRNRNHSPKFLIAS